MARRAYPTPGDMANAPYGCAVLKGRRRCSFETRNRVEAERHWAVCEREGKCGEGCKHGLFESADRTYRCRGCHLHADMCNCAPGSRERLLRTVGFLS